jgi:hypothetical protein
MDEEEEGKGMKKLKEKESGREKGGKGRERGVGRRERGKEGRGEGEGG